MRSLPLRLGFFYFTYFAGLGVMLPYLNLYFERLGMNGFQIGALSAILPLGKVLLPPIWAYHADRTGGRRRLTIAACLLTVVALAWLLRASTFAGLVAACLALALVDGPRIPLVEATTVDAAQQRVIDYGRVRGWGSIGFVVSSVAMGVALALHPVRLVLWAMLGWAALNAAASFGLPEVGREEGASRHSLVSVLRRPAVWLFLLACFLMQASHGAYYAFFTIHMDRNGYPGAGIGGLWAVGVLAELVVMFFPREPLTRLTPVAVMCGCALLAAARWGVLALTAAPAAVVPAQLLHAFTFAAFHVASVTQTQRLFPPSLRAFGQSILSAMTYALGAVVGSFLSGLLFDTAGPWIMFGASSAVALLSAALLIALGRWSRPGVDPAA